MKLLALGCAVVVSLSFGGATPVEAKKKKDKPAKSACAGGIPVQLGNIWTYKGGRVVVLMRIAEIAPPKDGKTLVTVEEKLGDRAVTTVWTCTKEGLTVPSDSFFFVGEPGGGVGAKFTEKTHDGVTFPADLEEGTAFIEKATGEVERTDVAGGAVKHPPAKVEIERHVLIEGKQPVSVAIGNAPAIKVGFELRGRSTVGAPGAEEKVEFVIKRPGAAWIMPGLGILKLEDANDRTYELVSTTIPFSKE